jgi:hypothetical protein
MEGDPIGEGVTEVENEAGQGDVPRAIGQSRVLKMDLAVSADDGPGLKGRVLRVRQDGQGQDYEEGG